MEHLDYSFWFEILISFIKIFKRFEIQSKFENSLKTMSSHFVTTSNSPNATASMNSVSSAFLH